MKIFSLYAMCFGTLLSFCPLRAQDKTVVPTVTADEIAVYAAVLDSPSLRRSMGRPLIADTTSTFACDASICNGMSMGGCNGLRVSNETPAARMLIVRRDLPRLAESAITAFEMLNQKCVSIKHDIPSRSNYHFFSDSDIPSTWKYSTIVYFSSVGFNSEHNQALVNVGLMSAEDAEQSHGSYLLLEKTAGKWTISGSSEVWQLMSQH